MTAKTAPKVTLWEFFQQLGKTFMLPVALLSFCGIMLGIGSSLSSHDVITLIPVLGNPVLQAIFTWMSKIGSFAFSFLPVMFCIAIPLGLARENKGVAAFAGFVGYAVMNLAVNFWLTNKGIMPTTDAAVLKANNIQSILGIQSIDTGILGAVIAGIPGMLLSLPTASVLKYLIPQILQYLRMRKAAREEVSVEKSSSSESPGSGRG